jgi:uncharacterized protein (TIGR03067 family)
MNLLSLAVVAFTLFTGQATTAPAPALSKEVAALQGVWNITLMNDEAAPDGAMAVQFEGMKYAVIINGGVDETGTFKLDATKTPWTFDLTIVEGTDAGKVQLGILEMKGDAIHGLLGTPGEATRPANFDSADGAIAFVAQKKK